MMKKISRAVFRRFLANYLVTLRPAQGYDKGKEGGKDGPGNQAEGDRGDGDRQVLEFLAVRKLGVEPVGVNDVAVAEGGQGHPCGVVVQQGHQVDEALQDKRRPQVVGEDDGGDEDDERGDQREDEVVEEKAGSSGEV
jgi:hypothetical protein